MMGSFLRGCFARAQAAAVAASAAVVLGGADAALACPACGAAKSENGWAFGVTIVILGVVPLSVFGGLAYWLRRAAVRARAESGAVAVRQFAWSDLHGVLVVVAFVFACIAGVFAFIPGTGE